MGWFVHMKLDVQGAINNLRRSRARYAPGYEGDDGKTLLRVEAIAKLEAHLVKGNKYLPIGECEGFDTKTGCPGHETVPDRDLRFEDLRAGWCVVREGPKVSSSRTQVYYVHERDEDAITWSQATQGRGFWGKARKTGRKALVKDRFRKVPLPGPAPIRD